MIYKSKHLFLVITSSTNECALEFFILTQTCIWDESVSDKDSYLACLVGQTSEDCHDNMCRYLDGSGFPCPDANQAAKGKPLFLISCISTVISSLFKLPPGPVMSTASGSACWSRDWLRSSASWLARSLSASVSLLSSLRSAGTVWTD